MGQTAVGSAMEPQKTSGVLGSEAKPAANTTGGSPFKPSEPLFTGGTGIHSPGNSNRFRCMCYCGDAVRVSQKKNREERNDINWFQQD